MLITTSDKQLKQSRQCVFTGEQAADGEATARANQQLPRPAQGHPHGRHQERGRFFCIPNNVCKSTDLKP